MSRKILAISIAAFSVFLITDCQSVNAQSGSRNNFKLDRKNQIITAEQQRLENQKAVWQQQANVELQRQRTLQQVANNPNSQFNKNQFIAAFKDAKAEFMAIHRGQIVATGRNLNRIYVLRGRDFNRKARSIKWPKALLAEPHKELTEVVDEIVAGKGDATQINVVLKQLNQQLEQRVVAKSINIKDYATAKRFVSGLANEAML